MPITTPIDSVGDVFLGTNSADPAEFVLIDNTTSPNPTEVALELAGSAVTDALDPTYTIIQAEKDVLGGYTLLLTDGSTYRTWDVAVGGELAAEIGPLIAAEDLFDVNLDTVDATNTDDGTDDALIGVSELGRQYFVIDTTTTPATEVGLLLNGNPVNADTFGAAGWTITQAVANPDTAVGGYKVLFENSDGQVLIWTHDADGNRIGRDVVVALEDVGAPDEAAVWAAEELFQVDLAADAGTDIGNPSPGTNTVIATDTDLGADGARIGINDTTAQYFVIDTTTATEVGLKLGGNPVNADTFGDAGWTITQAVANPDTAVGGYKVLFENSDGQVLIWTHDADGNRIGRDVVVALEDVGAPDEAAVWAAEELFQVDLAADAGTDIGNPSPGTNTVIATDTDLGADGARIGINDTTAQYFVIDTTTATEVGLKLGGNPVNADTFGDAGWTITQAVANPDTAVGGYKVLFENSDGQVLIWTHDADGNRIGRDVVVALEDVGAPDEAAVWAAEELFQVDLAADAGTDIGNPSPGTNTVIATDTDLGADGARIGINDTTAQYFVIDTTTATEVGLKLGGNPVNADTFGDAGWTITQAVANPDTAVGGYKVLFENSDGQVLIWTHDADGNRIGRDVVVALEDVGAPDEAAVWAAEELFQVDLAADAGTDIGNPSPGTNTVIATDTDLGADGARIGINDTTAQYFVIDTTTATEVGLKLGGNPVNADTFGDAGWTITQAVANPDTAVGGYKVLFENSDGQVLIWTHDADGNRIGRDVVVALEDVGAPDEAAVWAAEELFQVDLAADAGTDIGNPSPGTNTVIATDTDLGADGARIGINDTTAQYFVIDTTTATEVGLKLGGNPVNADTFGDAGWTITQAVANPDTAVGGYKVLFENSDGQVLIWTHDADGNRIGRDVVVALEDVGAPDEAAVWAAEELFQVDLAADAGTDIGNPSPGTNTVIATDTDLGADGARIGINDTTAQYFVIDTTTATEVGLKLGGNPVNADTFGDAGWTITQAVANPDTAVGGYKVLFENSDGQVLIWTHDADGNRIGRDVVVALEDVGAPDEAAVWAAEELFQVDLAADAGTDIGNPGIDAVFPTNTDNGEDGALIGVNDLTAQYFVIDTTGEADVEVGLKLNGVAVNADTFGAAGWTITQAVANPDTAVGGYKVLFENSDGQVLIWTHDADGNRTGRDVVVALEDVGAPDEATVWAAEELFQVDLAADADTLVGDPTAIRDTGTDTDGPVIGVGNESDQYFVIDGSAEIGITADAAPVTAAGLLATGWTITQATADPDPTADGYLVLLENTNGDYSFWTLDSTGQRTDVGPISGDSIKSAEVVFGVDLVGGIEVGVVEDLGDVTLSINEFGDYSVSVGAGDPVFLSFDPDGAGPEPTEEETPFLDDNTLSDTFVWVAVAAEEDPDVTDGYRLLWEGTDGDGVVTEYFVQEYDETGIATSAEGIVSVEAAELEFTYDIPDTFVFALT